MKLPFFLTINSKGSVKATKNKPSLEWNEISIQMSITLPDALFKKPQLSANITIPDEAAVAKVIAADVQDNVKEAIQQATGMEVKLNLVAPQFETEEDYKIAMYESKHELPPFNKLKNK